MFDFNVQFVTENNLSLNPEKTKQDVGLFEEIVLGPCSG